MSSRHRFFQVHCDACWPESFTPVNSEPPPGDPLCGEGRNNEDVPEEYSVVRFATVKAQFESDLRSQILAGLTLSTADREANPIEPRLSVFVIECIRSLTSCRDVFRPEASHSLILPVAAIRAVQAYGSDKRLNVVWDELDVQPAHDPDRNARGHAGIVPLNRPAGIDRKEARALRERLLNAGWIEAI